MKNEKKNQITDSNVSAEENKSPKAINTNQNGSTKESSSTKQDGSAKENNSTEKINNAEGSDNADRDPNFEADSSRKINARDIIFLEICRKSEEQLSDRFDSENFFKEYVTDNFEVKEDEFNKMLRELETYGYIKINDETGETRENLTSEKPSIQIMEEGKKYKLVLEENLSDKKGQ